MVTFEAFQRILQFTSRFASNKLPRSRWTESMGFLFCKVEGDEYVVADAVGMTSGDEMAVNISPAQLGDVEQLEEERPGLFLGGWFHTHPGLSLFFSETDVRNQTFYQQYNEDGLGLVFDHDSVSGDFIGFKIFRLDSKDSTEYHEVAHELRGFTARGLFDAFAPLGVGKRVLEDLAHHLGLTGPPPPDPLPRVDAPRVDDVEAAVEQAVEESQDLLDGGDSRRALERALVAVELSKLVADEELEADAQVAAIDACVASGHLRAAWELIQGLEGSRPLPYDDYYAGRLAVAKARLFLREGNLASAVEAFAEARRQFTESENYERAFEASMAAAELLGADLGDPHLQLKALRETAELVGLAKNAEDEDPFEWGERERRVADLVKKVNDALRSTGLQRVW